LWKKGHADIKKGRKKLLLNSGGNQTRICRLVGGKGAEKKRRCRGGNFWDLVIMEKEGEGLIFGEEVFREPLGPEHADLGTFLG